jgi:hypothetical protein
MSGTEKMFNRFSFIPAVSIFVCIARANIGHVHVRMLAKYDAQIFSTIDAAIGRQIVHNLAI